jgi:ParB family chromosome partitioning protein
MSKLDELRRAAGMNVAESMSKDLVRPAATHGASAPAPAGPDRWAGLERLGGAQRIPISRIERDPGQPREVFEEAELAELAESIRARGMLQPIRVRWDEGRGMYVVIAGERRLRAAGIAGQADVPCVVHDAPLSEAEILLDQLAENIVRLDLQPIEQARAFRRLMDANGWSARRLAEELHIDHDKVNRAVRLLELPGPVQAAVAGGALPPTTAYELSKLPNPAAQAELATRAVAEGLSRDDVAAAVRRPAGSKAGLKGRGGAKARKATSRTLRTSAGCKVTVENRRGVDDEMIVAALEEILSRIRGELEGRREAVA